MRLRASVSALPRVCTSLCLELSVSHREYTHLRSGGLLRPLRGQWDRIHRIPANASKGVPKTRKGLQATPPIWLERIRAMRRRTPEHAHVLWLDSDAFPCDGWPSLFEQLVERRLDVLSARPIVPFSGSGGDYRLPAPAALPPTLAAQWANFPERNLGIVALQGGRAVSSLLGAWEEEYVREANDRSLYKLRSDQASWRVALFGALRMPDHGGGVHEARLSGSVLCRLATRASVKAHLNEHGGDGGCGKCLFIHTRAWRSHSQGVWQRSRYAAAQRATREAGGGAHNATMPWNLPALQDAMPPPASAGARALLRCPCRLPHLCRNMAD